MKGLHVTILILVPLISYLLLVVAAYSIYFFEHTRSTSYCTVPRDPQGCLLIGNNKARFMTKSLYILFEKVREEQMLSEGQKDEK